MECCLVALDKSPGVRPVGIGETLRRALAKLIMREAGDQAKTACGNLKLCAGLKAGIEGEAHAVGQRRIKRVRVGLSEDKEVGAFDEEEETGGVAASLNNFRIDTAATEDETEEIFMAEQEMEVEEGREDLMEEEEEGDGTQRALGALDLLTKDSDPSVTTIVDAHNGFNDMSWKCCGPCGITGWQGQGSHSIAICIGRNFYSAIQGSRQLEF